MSKTWKDLPQNVEGAVKRKKPVQCRRHTPASAALLTDAQLLEAIENDEFLDWEKGLQPGD